MHYRLTNCMDSRVDKHTAVMILVKCPAYVMLSVDLRDVSWHENTALQTLKRLQKLIRPKRFMAALILAISALIAILTTFAISITAWVQETHTAQFVNKISKKNISLALSEQAVIDKKLE